MSHEGIEALIQANESRAWNTPPWQQEPIQYEMRLNPTDFAMMIRCLEFAYRFMGLSDQLNTSDWAGDFISGIAQTLDIEFI